MKVKVGILALILIGMGVCLPHHTIAVDSPDYFNLLGYPGEHPWQDLEPPPDDEIMTSGISSGIIIIALRPPMIMIKAPLIKSKTETTGQAPKKIEFGSPTKKGND
jgi:hypothetical protein